ncbi:MFS general substrate transporter [Polychaeton citri CBS 116435]|uniref:Cercosporin MFS transporter CTB4 n=1 Tax=Polychaeton citri CBS 116435 TaxID=1314669 RepID=A0A9P4Q462_9PEZI|nr:MFS general substrate transporter [Polychaeton citri CBS 116435]
MADKREAPETIESPQLKPEGEAASTMTNGGDSQHSQEYNKESSLEDAQPQSYLVEWDGPNDPENPQNFSFALKAWITLIPAAMTFVASLGSSIFSAAVVVTAQEFGVSQEVMILGIALYVLGFACGPLVWGPMSEIYGRRTPLMIGFFGFIIFQIPVAVASNLQTIFICRFLSGCCGAAPLSITAGMYVDIFDLVARGKATMVFAAAVFAGPSIGPVIGEFTVKNAQLGWRWTLWITMILAAFFFIIALPTLPETLAPVILQRKAARLRLEKRQWALHSQLDEQPVHFSALMSKYGLKPAKMLIREPILALMTIYTGLVYAILYLTFFALPFSFESDRRWEFGKASLPFIAIFVGIMAACGLIIWEMTVIFTPKVVKAKKPLPEERLPSMIVGSFILIIGLFWFAWTSYPSVNPWPQIISCVLIGCGIICVFMPGLIYLVDVYLFDANSALAANAFIRSVMAAAFPMFASPLFKNLGVRWATSLLGFLCIALAPAPILFYIYGKKIRGWSKYAYDLG